jgi:methylmalonyl-CoA mutase
MLISERIQQFINREGRRPRVLVSNLGKKSHDQYCRFLSSFFAENGFDVDLSPLHQTPRGTARMAIENDVHLICFLSTENRHESLVTSLAKALRSEQGESIKIIMGGFIPRSDYDHLHSAGAALILNSGPPDQEAVHQILDLFN